MKKLLLVGTVIVLESQIALASGAFGHLMPQKEEAPVVNHNERFCSIFTQKAKDYEANMRDDHFAKKTLESYKKRAKLFCDKSKKEQL